MLKIAGIAESVDGGNVNASEVQIGSVPVIDGNRNWVGEPISVDWSSIQNIPEQLQMEMTIHNSVNKTLNIILPTMEYPSMKTQPYIFKS